MARVKKRLFLKRTADEKSNPNNVNPDYEEELKKAVSIVDKSLAKGHYSEISPRLKELPSTAFQKTQYFFEAPGTSLYNGIICISLVFLLGYLYFAFIGIGIIRFSDDYGRFSQIYLLAAGLVLIFNVFLIRRSIKALRFIKRYNQYAELFKYKNVHIIDDICNTTKIAYSIVVNDLEKAVKQKLIPQGHFTTDNLVFIASDQLYAKYEADKPAYDRYYKKIIEERIRIEERSEEVQKIMELGQGYIKKINDSSKLIKNRDIQAKLDQMEKTVSAIFYEVDLNPKQSNKLGMLLNYYLPTTEKLLAAYIDIDEKNIEGNSIRQAKKDIEYAIDMLIVSFEGILNQFYEAQEMDIASEVAVMESMMK